MPAGHSEPASAGGPIPSGCGQRGRHVDVGRAQLEPTSAFVASAPARQRATLQPWSTTRTAKGSASPARLAPGAGSPTPGVAVPSSQSAPVTTPSGRHGRCPVMRAVIVAAAVFLVATSCTGPRAQVTYGEGHLEPHRTFPPSPPAPLPSLVHGEITLIQGNSSMTTSIPVGTVVHLRLDSRRYDSPDSTYPLVLAQTSPPPPGVLADFRAIGLGSADLRAHEVDASTTHPSRGLVFHITVRGS